MRPRLRRFNQAVVGRANAALSSVPAVWAFAALGLAGIYYAVTGNVVGALIVNAVSGQFLQLVSLPLLGVGQKAGQQSTADLHEELHLRHDDHDDLLHRIHDHLTRHAEPAPGEELS